MNDDRHLALIGVGVMGTTLLSGLLKAGWNASSLVVADRRSGHRDEVGREFGVRAMDNVDAVRDAHTVVLVVKPQDVASVLDEVAPALPSSAVVVSLCAGVSTGLIEARLAPGQPVIRVMPNTPAMVGEGMAAISGGAHATPDQLVNATALMQAVGQVITVPEHYQDAVTAISGSGPAYLFFVAESMIEAGVHLGLPRDVSTHLVVQTMLGSATLLRESQEHPTLLRENVTSPAGTTAAAVRVLEEHRVRAAFMQAMEAARDRSAALAEAARTVRPHGG